jgi:pimeloyl-ACP methyl ester carboxylesterase
MGSLFFGGTVVSSPDGDTFHGDHGYAQYYVPQSARELPLIMWHGMGQSGRSWESTPDGREGFQAIFTRRDRQVYIIDQPRRGRAGYTQAKAYDPGGIPTTVHESTVWIAFRNGPWAPPQAAEIFPGAQFSNDPASIEQFFRQQTPNTGEEPFPDAGQRKFMADTLLGLLKRTGPSVLVTHSHSGQYGWATGMAAPDLVKAIIAYEPGSYSFLEGERPADVPFKNPVAGEVLQPQMVPLEEFKKLTKMSIIVIYGDNIATEPSDIYVVDAWRIASTRARQFVDAVNRHGGDATLVLLPEIGIKGNTHAPFADLNNVEIADHMEAWLKAKKLDGSAKPHTGPAPLKLEKVTIPLKQ